MGCGRRDDKRFSFLGIVISNTSIHVGLMENMQPILMDPSLNEISCRAERPKQVRHPQWGQTAAFVEAISREFFRKRKHRFLD